MSIADPYQSVLDELTHRLLHQRASGTLLSFSQGLELYQPGSAPYIDFHRAANPAGDSNVDYNMRLINEADGMLNLKGGALVVSRDGAYPLNWANDWTLSLVGSVNNNYTQLLMQSAPGALSASNILWWWRSDKANHIMQFHGWDGTTDKAFWTYEHPTGRMFMEDRPLCLRPWPDTNHNIKYVSSYAGQALDGPIIIGNSTTCLADVVNWALRTDNGGGVTARGQITAGNSMVGPNVSSFGQHKGYSSNVTHLSGTGNDLHFDWGSPFTIWVDVTNVKNFVIPHPEDEDHYLIHACIEAPEAMVVYRGQSRLKNGWVQIDLPTYFEALCAEEGRSVQLTAIADDPADEWCPVLHATYPKNGKFWVGLGSGVVVQDQKFWWEVKAVRKDVAPVNVEPLKTDVEVLGSGPYTYYKEK
jgi:hypothetical protein